jgi:ubiquinone/menaquinone biosynthesis C-methylase UbiE
MEYYNKIASGYHELHYDEQIKKLYLISEHLNIGQNDRILDVGCGLGFSSEVFNFQIIGLEPSRKMLILGRKEVMHKMEFLQGEGEHLPFSDNSFDVVICVTAIHNFQNPKKGLREIKRVSKGKGAITVLKKAKDANELVKSVNEIFTIEKQIDEDKDIILLFGSDKL